MKKWQKGKYVLIGVGAIIIVGLLWRWLPEICPYAQRERFGGVESLFTGLAFAMLIVTAWMQKEELELQRKELKGQKEQLEQQNETLKMQRFENTFFQQMSIFNDIVNSIDWFDRGGRADIRYVGRESLKYIHSRWVQTGNEMRDTIIKRRKMGEDELVVINEEWKEFYKEHSHDLGHYFRTLYNLIKLVKHAPEGLEKKKYTNIVRATLSDYETALLFYNLLSEYGNKEFKPLAEEFCLLKHVRDELLLDAEHKKYFHAKAFDKGE